MNLCECGKTAKAKGMCMTCYMKKYRNRKEVCSLEACRRSVYAMGLCEPDYKSDLRNRNPQYDTAQRAVNKKIKDTIDPEYKNAHQRVRYRKGRPSDYGCVDCDRPASSWSLSSFVNVEYGFSDRKTFPFSKNIEDYAPRCWFCHGEFDKIPASKRVRS